MIILTLNTQKLFFQIKTTTKKQEKVIDIFRLGKVLINTSCVYI